MTHLPAFQFLILASTLLLTLGVHTLVTHALALVAGRTLVRSPRHRGILWKAALLLPLATATLATAGWRPLAVAPDINLGQLTQHAPGSGREKVWVEQREIRRIGVPTIRSSFATTSTALDLAGGATALALIAALAGAARLLMRHHEFRRRLGHRTRIVACDGEMATRYQLTASPTLGAPVALGLAEICVPATTFVALSAAERRSVLAHEEAHLLRRDPAWFAIADSIVALFPWQPLVRTVVRQMRRDAEFCCDDAVVHAAGDGRALVRSLASFARGFDPAETALAASCGGSPLEERARRILEPVRPSTRWSSLGLVAALGLLVAGTAIAAPVISTRTTSIDRQLPADASRHERVIILTK